MQTQPSLIIVSVLFGNRLIVLEAKGALRAVFRKEVRLLTAS